MWFKALRGHRLHAYQATLMQSLTTPNSACQLTMLDMPDLLATLWLPKRLLQRASVLIMSRVGQNHIYTVYIRYFWQGKHQMYGAYIRFWPTLFMSTSIDLGRWKKVQTHWHEGQNKQPAVQTWNSSWDREAPNKTVDAFKWRRMQLPQRLET